VDMNGGNDSVTISNITLPGTFDVNMGDGNDTLVMNNVRDLFSGVNLPGPTQVPIIPSVSTIQLGSGNDTLLITSSSIAGNLFISAGDGRDAIVLNHVATGVIKTAFTDSQFIVDMGPGDSDVLSVSACTGDQTEFRDTGGTGGMLLRFGNHFNS